MNNKYLKNLKAGLSALMLILVIFIIIGSIGKVLIPFIIALILAYIFNPIVLFLNTKYKVKRSITAVVIALIVFLISFSIPLFLFPTIIDQIKNVISHLPAIIEIINNKFFAYLNTHYHTAFYINYDKFSELVISKLSSLDVGFNGLVNIARNSMIILEILIYMILIPFILFYSIINYNKIIDFFESLIPKSYSRNIEKIFLDIDRMLSQYLRGQISVMIIMALYYGFALKLINVSSGFAVGLLTGFLVFIPYLGILTGLIIALSITLASFTDNQQLIYILIAFGLGHLLEGAIVTPVLVGGKIGLNPVMVILALMIFGQLFGVVGVLLALPLAAITVVLLKHAYLYYLSTRYYNEQ